MQDLTRCCQNHVTDNNLALTIGRQILAVRQKLIGSSSLSLAGERDPCVHTLLTLTNTKIQGMRILLIGSCKFFTGEKYHAKRLHVIGVDIVWSFMHVSPLLSLILYCP